MKLKMVLNSDKKNRSSRSQSKNDLSNAWDILKANYKAFITTELFAFVAFIVVISFFAMITWGIVSILSDFSVNDLKNLIKENYEVSLLFRLGLWLTSLIVFFGFMNTQFGLANDIFNSGEMFADFKGSFFYFKKNWHQYTILTIILSAFSNFVIFGIFIQHRPKDIIQLHPVVALSFFCLQFVISGLVFLLVIHAFPSVAFQNKLGKALHESFLIFKREFKRVCKAWTLYLFIFIIPLSIVLLINIIYGSDLFMNLPFPLFAVIFLFIEISIGYPLMALLATGIYNNSWIRNTPDNNRDKINSNFEEK